MIGHGLGPCDQGWNIESQSTVSNWPSSGIHKPAPKHLSGEMSGVLWVGTWRWPRREARPLLGETTDMGPWQGLLTEQVGEKWWGMPRPSLCPPHKRAATTLNIPKRSSSRVWKGQSLGRQLCCVLAFQLEFSDANEKGKLLQQQGQSTAGCAQGQTSPSCITGSSDTLCRAEISLPSALVSHVKSKDSEFVESFCAFLK